MGSPELELALSVAQEAAQRVMEVYAGRFAVEFKGRNDPVTEADRRANEHIVCALKAAFPSDGICAEESATAESVAAAARGGRCWFVDPLDGTREFVSRNGEFCVMVGLAIGGVAHLGVVVAPAWNRTIWGELGHGAWERGVDGIERKLNVPAPPADLSHIRLVVSRSHRDERTETVAHRLGIRDVRPCGSVGLKAALVAAGEADVYIHAGRGPKLWDGCAPDAIARAAGACVTNWRGDALRYDTQELALDQGIIVAHPELHARVLSVAPSA